MVSKEELTYYRRILRAVEGANGRNIEFDKFRSHIAEKVKLAEHLRGKVVLDAGCGRGQSTSTLYELGAKEVIGVDALDSNLRHWRKNFSGEAIRSYFPYLPFSNASLDVVCASYLFDLIFDVRAGLKEVKRVLKPRGILYLLIQVNKVAGLEAPWGGRGEAVASYLFLPESIKQKNLYHYEPSAQFKQLLAESSFKLLREYRWRNHLAFKAQKL